MARDEEHSVGFLQGLCLWKAKMDIFRSGGKKKKTERLELVHTDVCGPTTVKFLGNNFNFVSFIDDASKKILIYAISQKSVVYHTFKKWKSIVKNETRNKIKCQKFDNGGEYRDGGFQEYNSNNGIRLILVSQNIIKKRYMMNPGYIWEQAMNDKMTTLEQNQTWDLVKLPVDDMLVAGSSIGNINKLKKKLASTFSMKDLGEAKQLLEMRITRDRKQRMLWLSQEEYIEKVWGRFNLHTSKPVRTPLAAHFKLSKELSPKTKEDEEYMAHVPYSSTVRSLMRCHGHYKAGNCTCS
ncbi:hypothetical protein RJ639_021282 [Escallonia herrerae]|uniref:Integrase catalytic domain-containing protein n=1 Tax=Escallonia herrerae TaxID=1293975 RepID=A0AA88V6W9_9ASTE|nr:hypothetical protein RJ639_021282 [Escallonia herrerae]